MMLTVSSSGLSYAMSSPHEGVPPVETWHQYPLTLIEHGRVIQAHSISEDTDILVVGETIAWVGTQLRTLLEAHQLTPTTCHDATGLWVIPGGIDPHTHLDMPFMGTTSSDDFETGTRAALYGGTTSIIDFIMQRHTQSFADAVAEWERKAQKAIADYTFHLAITDFSPAMQAELPWVIDTKGIRSFKVFMAYKEALQIDDAQLLKLFEMLQAYTPRPIVLAHAENGDMVDWLSQSLLKQGKTQARYHAEAHPVLAEAEATHRILALSQLSHQPIYVVHMTCHDALEALRKAHTREQVAYGETCIQYLVLDDSLYETDGFEAAKWVFSPPLRSKADQQSLWHALKHRTLSTVATDHCPFCMDQKAMGKDQFTKIPNGMPGIEHRMELLFSEGVVKGRLTPQDFVRLTSTAAAEIFGLAPKKGTLAVGADADIVLWHPTHTHTLSASTHHMRCDYSAFEGWQVTGKAHTVLRRGETLIHHFQATEACRAGTGQFLPR
ncbi:MAG: dihydropyrimidinase [Vampirovibrionales bacterium]